MTGNRNLGVRVRFVQLMTSALGAAALLLMSSEAVPKPNGHSQQSMRTRALEELALEATQYAADARDYRQLLGRIVGHHYERRRQLLLGQFDLNIAAESRKLRRARRYAIAQLEAFIGKHRQTQLVGEHTPDAMLRLAALYEERAREAATTSPQTAATAEVVDLEPAIALYEQIARSYPSYSQLATTLYHLGHAYFDTAQLERAQQTWRALVCSNHFRFRVHELQALPQDHDPRWWLDWQQRQQAGPRAAQTNTELVFVDPYPHDCRPLQPRRSGGVMPSQLAEAWWRIGDHHFEASDQRGGPYRLNRAASAYRHARSYPKPPVYDVATYKLAWTFYRQQRYQAAVKAFVELLQLADLREQQSGDPGTDFRSEAVTYIAGALTYRDFVGPTAAELYVPRDDIFDTETQADLIEKQMQVAITRVQDPQLIPQNEPWTITIYRALAAELKEYGQLSNVIELDKLALSRWPLAKEAPRVQLEIAEAYRALARSARGREHQRYSRLAREAQDGLAMYVDQPGRPPAWVTAHRDDPEVLSWAHRLLRDALRNAAVAHTTEARRLVARADAASVSTREPILEQALLEYRQAARAWGSYLWNLGSGADSYEDRFWLADAHAKVVAVQALLGKLPHPKQVRRAKRLARELRDSTESATLLQPAALLVVRVAQQVVRANQRVFEKSGGSNGIAPRTRLLTKKVQQGNRNVVEVVQSALPAPVGAMIAAFDEYGARVPAAQDPYANHQVFAFRAAEVLFLYGHLDAARKRLLQIHHTQCGKTKQGFAAWVKLLTIANLKVTLQESERLVKAAQKESCALTAADAVTQKRLVDGTVEMSLLEHARRAYAKAKQAKGRATAKRLWLEAGDLYAQAFDKTNDDGAEAALSGAHAFRRAGRYASAIGLYRRMIERFERSNWLRPSMTTPTLLEQRVKHLKLAYEELASDYVLSFDYARAAQTYRKLSEHSQFDAPARRSAAHSAVFLFAALEQPVALEAASKRFFSLGPQDEEMVATKWRVVRAALANWQGEQSPDRGNNRVARLDALRALKGFHRQLKDKPVAKRRLVDAAYQIARLHRAGGKPHAARRWCKSAVTAFDDWLSRAGSAVTTATPQADEAAECAYRAIDQALRKGFDYATGHHHYAGTITEVAKTFRSDVSTEASAHLAKLQTIINKYGSRRWAVTARARQGSLYDSLRTGLYFAGAPSLKLFSPKEQRLLDQLAKLCNRKLYNKPCRTLDDFVEARRLNWQQQRAKLLADVDKAMVVGYVEAIFWARAWHIPLTQTQEALRRLGSLTDTLGDALLRRHTTNLKSPVAGEPFVYTDRMFLRMRPGLGLKSAAPKVSTPPLVSLSGR